MPGLLTEITEIVTGLGMLGLELDEAMNCRPVQLRNVDDEVWARLVDAYQSGEHADSFYTAFANGQAFFAADDGLRGRVPRLVEWKGPHRPPGDDVVPADLRIDHVYLVSCKYLSKVLVNAGPARLFDRLLVGEQRTAEHWFAATAPDEYRAFYAAAREVTGRADLPEDPQALTKVQQQVLRRALNSRTLPTELTPAWAELSRAVAHQSAERWRAALTTPRAMLLLLWKLLRVGSATYFVLGTDHAQHIRLRVGSTWDWHQRYRLRSFTVEPRAAGQPEVGWDAVVHDRVDGEVHHIAGHVEIRWSHGRFVGHPEAKVYLDTPHAAVPGYDALVPAPGGAGTSAQSVFFA